jgi:Tfp pilus assembly pilus retraction ATPase PilT
MSFFDMNQLLEFVLAKTPDIHITVGRPPSFIISGSIKSLKSPVLTAD